MRMSEFFGVEQHIADKSKYGNGYYKKEGHDQMFSNQFIERKNRANSRMPASAIKRDIIKKKY